MLSRLDANVQKIIEMRKSGETKRAISKKLSLTHGEVSGAVAVLDQGLADVPINVTTLPVMKAAALRFLLKKPKTNLGAIAHALGCSTRNVRDIVLDLEIDGYNIVVQGERVSLKREIDGGKVFKIDVKKMLDRCFRFGIISDTHLGSNYERLDVCEAAYDEFARQKIGMVFHAGNIIEGQKNQFNQFDIKVSGVEGQMLYLMDHYPQRSGIVTKFLSADDHEGWWCHSVGLNIGRTIELYAKDFGRKDLEWIGHGEVDILLDPRQKGSYMRVVHPGGGSSYALSYRPQRIIESYQGGQKPQVVLFGHFHKMGYFYPREVHCILAGCASDQSRFMQKLSLAAHVGFAICSIHTSKQGAVSAVDYRFYPFYDKGYYTKNDHRWLRAAQLIESGGKAT